MFIFDADTERPERCIDMKLLSLLYVSFDDGIFIKYYFSIRSLTFHCENIITICSKKNGLLRSHSNDICTFVINQINGENQLISFK